MNSQDDYSHVGDIDDPTAVIDPESTGIGAEDDKRSSRFRRLKVINQHLRSQGFITFTEFKRISTSLDIKEVTRETFHADVDALDYMFYGSIKEAKFEDGSIGYFLTTRRIETTKKQREALERPRKEVIASLAGGLLLGEDKFANVFSVNPAPQKELIKLLRGQNGPGAQLKAESIIRMLKESAWRPLQRQIAIDSGTTNEVFCSEVLAKLTLPRPSLSRLNVCTNSRGIFNILGVPGVPIKTIIVGGQQLFQTEAIAGYLAEQFLKAANLSFSMSFIGATVVDLRNMFLGGDYDADSAIKSDFLSRSELKIVLADKTKFMGGSFAAYNRFAKIHPSVVDLIVTDEIDAQHMAKINEEGVPVLALKITGADPGAAPPTKLVSKARKRSSDG